MSREKFIDCSRKNSNYKKKKKLFKIGCYTNEEKKKLFLIFNLWWNSSGSWETTHKLKGQFSILAINCSCQEDVLMSSRTRLIIDRGMYLIWTHFDIHKHTFEYILLKCSFIKFSIQRLYIFFTSLSYLNRNSFITRFIFNFSCYSLSF